MFSWVSLSCFIQKNLESNIVTPAYIIDESYFNSSSDFMGRILATFMCFILSRIIDVCPEDDAKRGFQQCKSRLNGRKVQERNAAIL